MRRLNTQTMIVSIFLRKRIFHCMPRRLKHLISMNEVPLAVKSRLGGQLEHAFWFIMVVLTVYEPHILTYKLRDTHIVGDCRFTTRGVFKEFDYFSFCVLFIIFTSTDLVGLGMNYSSKYDLIKWTGGQDFNVVENVLTRMCGLYFFQSTFVFSFLITKYGYENIDKDKFQ